MTLRDHLGPQAHDEYMLSLQSAETLIHHARTTPNPTVAAIKIARARTELAMADERLHNIAR